MNMASCQYSDLAASAFNRRDVDALLALVHEDFVYLDGMGIQSGREAMRRRELALVEAFPDAQVILTPFVITEDRLALTGLLSGTFSAPLVLPGRVIAPHGRQISLHYAAHFTFKGRLAIREEAFFDSAALLLPLDQEEA
ncbi:ester cyclase [Pseudomonas sp. BBP2017]|uniref:ester cyclase n=1 Tax=Pseudomonas sp. BBP2017 TaxID=2109731 RepID=UPI000D11DDD3|nr:nuclear transport factor 2 family protein [Pseudomonas sp. BBP2017]PSS59323.1 ketosteroid isomerase [Pseudomonas sp. BBP2017]